VSKRGERRDIFSCLNAYDVFFMFLEEERHRKGDGGWLVLRVLPVKWTCPSLMEATNVKYTA